MSGFRTLRMTPDQVEAHQRRMQKHVTGIVEARDGRKVLNLQVELKPTKYGNRKCVVDGERFDSEKEAGRWRELKLREYAKEIKKLRRQVSFRLTVNRIDICAYTADFVYVENRRTVVEDVKGYKKGMAYRVFRIKAALMLALHNLKVQEI